MKTKLLSIFLVSIFITSCSNSITPTTPINNKSDSYISDGITLINAIKSNNVEKVKELLSKNINLKIQNSNGETPLMIASEVGNKKIVELICNKYKQQSIKEQLDFNWESPKSYVELFNPFLYYYNKYANFSYDYLSFLNYNNKKSFYKSIPMTEL